MAKGYEVQTAASGEAALAAVAEQPFDVVISDIRMPGMGGIELLRQLRMQVPDVDVILVTAHATADSAIEALRLGAHDYITKPFDLHELKLRVRRAVERRALQRENLFLKDELADRHRFDNIVGASRAMQRVFDLIHRVKSSTSTVLITGQSGTGKELVARAVHYNGDRAAAPFVTINCAALPAQLLESELFGHVKGSFTGADRHKQGLFEAAEGGTILLDEIGDMPLEMQPKLLRVLEDRRVRRVGSTVESAIDVRVLASTNKELRTEIAGGTFREDLYYRLNVIQIDLPPLSERATDLVLLIEHFLADLRPEAGDRATSFSAEATRYMCAYDWPGNVRELENAVRHAVTMARGATIELEDLPAFVRLAAAESPVAADAASARRAAAAFSMPAHGLDLDAHLEDVRRDLMLQALERADGVQTRAAELLGISFRSFRYYLKKLEPQPSRSEPRWEHAAGTTSDK